MAEEKEKVETISKAIVDVVLTYQCPGCGNILGDTGEDETELNEKNEFRIEIKSEEVDCQICKAKVSHDPIVITTLKPKR